MNVEEKLEDCGFNLKQIKHFNPDPHYVNYFLKNYLQSVINVYDGIFEEANRDFGLFVSGKCTKEKFEKKAKEKNDNLALEFFLWFNKNYKIEHENPYPKYIKSALDFFIKHRDLPKITIKLIANQRYKNDIVQEIKVELPKGRIRSKDQLKKETNRQISFFLELINQKRKNCGEPKVSENQVIASTFLKIQDYEDVEISYACDLYLPVIKRIIEESRREIKRLTTSVD